MIQCSHTVESVEFMAANFCVNYGYFAYSWGYNFLDASAFSLVRKLSISKFVFVKDVNARGSASHEYHKN